MPEPRTDRHLPKPHVEFFFDIMCPYAFQTSLWTREVRDELGLDVDWSFLSLEEINRRKGGGIGRDEKPGKHPWEREWSYGWSMLRIAAWLKRQSPHLCDAWYLAAGKSLHVDGMKPFLPDGAREVITTIGIPESAVDDAIADPTTTDEVRADHERCVREYGGFGVPTIVLDGKFALFGPVVAPAPTGPAALDLWDLTCRWREFPHLYEIQHPKRPGDLAHIADAFSPYLMARQWNTIQQPAP